LTCRNNGTYVELEPRADDLSTRFACLCLVGFIGTSCEIASSRLIISFHDIAIPSLIFLHFIQVIERKEHKRIDTFKKIPIDQESISIYSSLDFQILFVEFRNDNYLAYLQRSDLAQPTEITLSPQHRCPSISQIFNETFAGLHPLRRIKHYHKPCQMDHKLHCFYDERYMCLCGEDHRANCLTFDHNKTYKCQDDYGDCENGAQCFLDGEDCQLSSACLCLDCYYGSKCQFSTYGLGLSLDAILGYHIKSNVQVSDQSTYVKVSIGLTTIIFIVGTISSLLSILTFQAKQPWVVGCGVYLLGASISSLLSIWIFTCKVLFLLLSQMALVTNRSFLRFQCVFIDFLLQVFLSFEDWLIACVAFERATAVIQSVRFNKSKSQQIAKKICFILFLFTVCTSIHDPFHRRLLDDEEEQRTWCIVRYSTTFQRFNSIIRTLHFLVPFLINLISALIIITMTARLRTYIHKNFSFKQLFIKQLLKFKHLFVSLIVLTILALPRLIIDVFSSCMTSARDPNLFLIGYFTSIIPRLLIFVVFVLPSEVYKKAFLESAQKYLPQRFFRN
jgi:hypothetical protein